MLNNLTGYYLFIPLIITAIGICVFSYHLSKAAVGIQQKTKLNSGFIGIVLISFTTSLPEMVTAFFSPLISDAKYATYNMLGSNTLTQTALVTILLFFISRDYFKSFSKTNLRTNFLLILTSLWLILPFFFPWLNKVVFEMSLQLLVFLIFYIILIFKIGFVNEKNALEEKTKFTKKQAITRFAIFAILLTITSIFLLKVVDKIAQPISMGGTGLAMSLIGTLFLSISTTLPEVLTFFWLLKMNTHNIAINSILGSDLFNLFVLALADLFVIKGGAINFVYNEVPWSLIQRKFLFTLPAYVLMFVAASLKMKNKKWLNWIVAPTTIIMFLWSFKLF